ncbi:hypothetical protein PIIN_10910 [Serendipita indica DSM 11827]|uniref:Kinesin light chain n=1 Tax=Serendipita indica (strain DSM 11827) TaxID=1109443 RepID=G4U034_SERID|nr:hypothetical protein PIIN_10910 [Serendipita indica DSM 11827]
MKPTSSTQSVEIVKELGMLALAITQAGAYIRRTRRLDSYLSTFRKHRMQLMRKEPGTGIHYKSSTYSAFDLSFRRLPTKTQEFMKLCAFLHHSMIPSKLFEQSIASGFATLIVRESLPPPENDKAFISQLAEIFGLEWDEITFQETIDAASRASLISVSTDGLSYTVHPLLQTYIKDGLNEEENHTYMRMTSQFLLGAMKSGKLQLWQLLPHINSIPRSVQSEDISHALAFHDFYRSLTDWAACRELLEPALSKVVATRGQRDADSLWLTQILARTLCRLGQLEMAERMQREILDLLVETFGRGHLDTIWGMESLATTLYECGQLEEAEKMQREALSLRSRKHIAYTWTIGGGGEDRERGSGSAARDTGAKASKHHEDTF